MEVMFIAVVGKILLTRPYNGLTLNDELSFLTAVLGAIAAFLAIAEKAEIGVLDLNLWVLVGILVGVPAFTVFWFILAFAFGSNSKRRRKRKGRKPPAP